MKRKVAFKYGIISGLIIVSTWFLTIFGQNDFSGGELLGYGIMIAALGSTMFIAIKKIRDEKGTITFKEGFLNGLGISLVASIIYVVGWMIFMPAFAPDFIDNYTVFTN